ncbi:hypothetical protein K8I61_15880 [bacterium]|nr:hypothetical protein [bacterium]
MTDRTRTRPRGAALRAHFADVWRRLATDRDARIEALLDLIRYPAFAILFLTAFTVTGDARRERVPADEARIAEIVFLPDDPGARVGAAALILAIVGALISLADVARGRRSRGVGLLFVPMLLAAVFVQADAAFSLAAVLTIALALFGKLVDHVDVTDGLSAPIPLFARVPLALLAAGSIALAVALTSHVPAVAPATWAVFLVLAFASLGFDARRAISLTGTIALFVAAGGIAYFSIASSDAVAGEAATTLSFLALAGALFVSAFRRIDVARAPNLVILGVILATLGGVEWTLASADRSRIEAPPESPAGTPAADDEMYQGWLRKADAIYIGKVIPPRFMRGMNETWFVEVGRIRGARPLYEKPPGAIRVVAIGSSSTEGWGIDDDKMIWTARLQSMLRDRAADETLSVVNAGIGGTTTFRMMLNLKHEMIRYDPDVVIVYAGHNDKNYSYGRYTDRELFDLAQVFGVDPREIKPVREYRSVSAAGGADPPEMIPRASDRLRAALSRSAAYRALREFILGARDRFRPPPPIGASDQPRAVPIEDFVANLRDMLDICRRSGARLVLVAEAESPRSFDPYDIALTDFARRHAVPYLLGDRVLDDECGGVTDSLFLDDVHLTAVGHECLARGLARLFAENEIIPLPFRAEMTLPGSGSP